MTTMTRPALSMPRFAAAAMLALVLIAMVPNPAEAFITPMGFVLCQIVGFVYGNMGRGMAIIAVVVLGVGATLGKVSWGLAITVVVGISVVFGAPTILQYIAPAPAGAYCGVA